jgi:hypothetical protein
MKASPAYADNVGMGMVRWMGAGLLAGAAALYVYSRTVNDPAQWKGVESVLPLAVMDRQTVAPEFTATASAKYLIEIEFQTAAPSVAAVKGLPGALGCLAGVLRDGSCKGLPDLLDVTWSVASAGSTIAVGASKDFEGQGSIDEPNKKMTRLIGRFPAEKGDLYSLKLNLHGAPPGLAGGNAKLKVRPDVTKEVQAGSGFQPIWILALGGVGLVLVWLGGFERTSLATSAPSPPPQEADCNPHAT